MIHRNVKRENPEMIGGSSTHQNLSTSPSCPKRGVRTRVALQPIPYEDATIRLAVQPSQLGDEVQLTFHLKGGSNPDRWLIRPFFLSNGKLTILHPDDHLPPATISRL